MAVCEGSYPAVLVFSFLEELKREFTITFQSHDVQKARRPYSFVEFGKQSFFLFYTLVKLLTKHYFTFMFIFSQTHSSKEPNKDTTTREH